jgi:hypothetical protein
MFPALLSLAGCTSPAPPVPSANDDVQSQAIARARQNSALMMQLCPDGVINNSVCMRPGKEILILAPGAKQLTPPRRGWQPTNAGSMVCFEDCGMGPPTK